MTPGDLAYLRAAIEKGLIRGPVLEVGGRSWQPEGNAAETCRAAGLDWTATDLVAGDGVEYVLDVLDPTSVGEIERRWPTILVFNLLEHVYDPITALRHALLLLEPGGLALVVTPAVWELHDFPADYWRPMPDFYTEFAAREGVDIVADTFKWITGLQLHDVDAVGTGNQKALPGKASAPWRSRYSDAVHKLANTSGRGLYFPYSALGVGFRKPS